MSKKTRTLEEENKLLTDLEEALSDPILRGTVGLGIYARELCASMGVAHTILLLSRQAKRLIDGAVKDEEEKAELKLAIIEDFADKVFNVDLNTDEEAEALREFLEQKEESKKTLTKKKEELN